MSSHFHCIGFPVREMREYQALMRQAVAGGVRLPLPAGGALVRWAVGGGPEIWVLLDPRGEAVDATPFYHIGTPRRVAVTAVGEDPDEAAAGWLEGWIEPVEPDEPISGAFPARIDLINFPLVRGALHVGTIVDVEFCAIAHEATLFADAAAYAKARQVQYQPPLPSFLSVTHFAADAPEGEPEATALITGVAEEARLLTNPATEVPYWRLRLATEKESVWVLIDQETLPADARPGNVVSASCWIVGRVELPADRAAEPTPPG